MNWGEIDNAWAFLAVLAGLVTNLVITIIGQRRGIKRRDEDREVLADLQCDTKAVRYQVNNDHPDEENLRDQLDRMEDVQKRTNEHIAEMSRRQVAHGRDINGLREDVGAVRDDVGGLRGELRDDRTNLREFKAGVNGFIKRVHPGEDPL